MDPDVIPKHESRCPRSRLQQHPTSSVSVPFMENWMPQLVTDSRHKPAFQKTPRKMPSLKKQPTQSDDCVSHEKSVITNLDVKESLSKFIGKKPLNGAQKAHSSHRVSHCKTGMNAPDPNGNRKAKLAIEDERHFKKEEVSKIGLASKEGKIPAVNVENDDKYKTNSTFSRNLPHYMKPLNRSVFKNSVVVEQTLQTKGKIQSQSLVKKKAESTVLPVRIPAKDDQLNSKYGLESSTCSQIKAIKEQSNVNHQRKTPKAPACSPVLHQCTREVANLESWKSDNANRSLLRSNRKVSEEVLSHESSVSCKAVGKKEILESSHLKVSSQKDVQTYKQEIPLSQAREGIAVSMTKKVAKAKKKTSVNFKKSSFVTKKPSISTPLNKRPKTKGIQNRPFRGAVADPLKGELPPNGNLQCKPEGMKNFISTIGMPFYGLPVSHSPQYSDTYLDMLDEAGIKLRKAIRESVQVANKKLQDPKPWMPARFACPPRKRPVSPREFKRRPRSPETMIWRLAKEDIIMGKKTIVRTPVPLVLAKTPKNKSETLGSRKKMASREHKKHGEEVTAKKSIHGSTVTNLKGNTDFCAQQAVAARILALMESNVGQDDCICNSAQRVNSLVTQNMQLQQEVRQLERKVIDKRHNEKLRGRSCMDVNIKRKSS